MSNLLSGVKSSSFSMISTSTQLLKSLTTQNFVSLPQDKMGLLNRKKLLFLTSFPFTMKKVSIVEVKKLYGMLIMKVFSLEQTKEKLYISQKKDNN